MRRFVRFVVVGVSSPSAVAAGWEPMPAPTMRGRLAQWRRRARWQAEIQAEAKAWAAANPMSPDEFMEACHRSARTLYLLDNPADYDYGEEDDDDD